MFKRRLAEQRTGRNRLGAIVAAIAALTLLSGCVVYVQDPPHRHYYWR
jgi:hypothetical protein